MPTRQIATDRRRKQKPASRFQRLWAEAETLSKDNAELEKGLEAVVKRINEDIFTAERKLGETIRLFVYRQLDFAHKKSLLKWQREELNDWIDDNLSELVAMGLLDEPLQDKLAVLRASQMGITLDPDSDLSPTEQLDKQFDAEVVDFDKEFNTSEGRARNRTDDLFDDEDLDNTFDDELGDDDDDDLAELLRKLHAEFEEKQERMETPTLRRKQKPVSDKVFKRLFQQTAAALHPDKETDPDRRVEKHALMSELLKARKDHDLITIVKLHEQHTNADADLNADDEKALEEVLVEYLIHQRVRLGDIISQSPLHQMAYSQFYHKKPATVTRRINAHLKQIDTKREALLSVLETVKTLKSFKEILAARYDAQMMRGDWF